MKIRVILKKGRDMEIWECIEKTQTIKFLVLLRFHRLAFSFFRVYSISTPTPPNVTHRHSKRLKWPTWKSAIIKEKLQQFLHLNWRILSHAKRTALLRSMLSQTANTFFSFLARNFDFYAFRLTQSLLRISFSKSNIFTISHFSRFLRKWIPLSCQKKKNETFKTKKEMLGVTEQFNVTTLPLKNGSFATLAISNVTVRSTTYFLFFYYCHGQWDTWWSVCVSCPSRRRVDHKKKLVSDKFTCPTSRWLSERVPNVQLVISRLNTINR